MTTSNAATPIQAPVSTQRAVLNTIKGSAGNLVEWYEVYVYTVFATYFETVIGYVILTGYTSVNAIVKAEVFPASIRALGVGLGYAIANSMFGGTAPVIYQALSAAKQTTWFIIYVTAVIAMSLVVYIFFMKNRAVTALDREQGHAWGEPVAAEGMRAGAGGR